MTTYTVSGEFETTGGVQQFTRTIEAPNADVAEERTLSQFGAEHGLGRNRLTIADVTEGDE